jgi:hypothetical protein
VILLNAQITKLHEAIENLNASFLTFTDALVASGCLDQDPQVTTSLQRTIEHFINVVQESHVVTEDTTIADDDTNSGLTCTEWSRLDDVQGAVFQPVNISSTTESTTESNTEEHPSTIENHDLCTAFNWPKDAAPCDQRDLIVQVVQNTLTTKALDEPMNSQNPPYKALPVQNDTFSYMPHLPRSVDSFRPTFAQKLHLEAIRAGLRLVCSAENNSQLFFRVFNRVLDNRTRESYRAHLSRILGETFSQTPGPPPESETENFRSRRETGIWFNASDVARYFRSIGIDFDSSPDIVHVEVGYHLPSMWHDTQDLPATEFAKPHGNSFANSANFIQAVGDVNNFRIFDYHTKYFRRSVISVNVSTLIQGRLLTPSGPPLGL